MLEIVINIKLPETGLFEVVPIKFIFIILLK